MTIVKCAYCEGSGKIAGWFGPNPCPVCEGRSEVYITYDNPQKCYLCDGRGTKSGFSGITPCPLCHGIGVIRPVLFD